MQNIESLEQNNTQIAIISERIAALRQQAQQEIILWAAADGTVLCGELIGSRIVVTQFGQQEQFIVRDEQGRQHCYWLSNFIKQQLQARKAELGSIVAITSRGKQTTASGKQYNAFEILVG